jgi:16S rRNA (guanine527-N7)-methyltransferase
MKNIINILNKALIQNNFDLKENSINQLAEFLTLLMQWNKVFNLTAIDEMDKVIYLHIIDSLLIASYIKGNDCLDIGSGGGLPGIPLAILFPEKQWTLLDKNNKKTRFLTQVIAQLSLTNVNIAHARCEDFQFKTGFDSILSRAFGTLDKLIEVTAHLLRQDGRWIAMKGQYPHAELQDLPANIVYEVHPINMTGMSVDRHVVCMHL